MVHSCVFTNKQFSHSNKVMSYQHYAVIMSHAAIKVDEEVAVSRDGDSSSSSHQSAETKSLSQGFAPLSVEQQEAFLFELEEVWPRVVIVGDFGKKLFGASCLKGCVAGTPPEFLIFDSVRDLIRRCHDVIVTRSPEVKSQHAATALKDGPERHSDLVDYCVFDNWLHRPSMEMLFNAHVLSSAAECFRAKAFSRESLLLATTYAAEIIGAGEQWVSFVSDPAPSKHWLLPKPEIPVIIWQRMGTVFLEAHDPREVPKTAFDGVQVLLSV